MPLIPYLKKYWHIFPTILKQLCCIIIHRPLDAFQNIFHYWIQILQSQMVQPTLIMFPIILQIRMELHLATLKSCRGFWLESLRTKDCPIDPNCVRTNWKQYVIKPICAHSNLHPNTAWIMIHYWNGFITNTPVFWRLLSMCQSKKLRKWRTEWFPTFLTELNLTNYWRLRCPNAKK